MTRFILATILFATSSLLASDVATAAANAGAPRNEATVAWVSAHDQNAGSSEFRHVEDSFHIDHKLDGVEVAQAVSNTCNAWPVWCYVHPAIVGTPCYCVVNGFTYNGYVQ